VDEDRLAYVERLSEQCGREGVRLVAYCLMTNHVHLLAIPAREDSLQRAVGRTHYQYAQHINRLHGRRGHLWQGRFFSCAMDESHAMEAARYVERNPVRARLTRVPWTYRWSSAAAHVGSMAAHDVLDAAAWHDLIGGLDWKEWIMERDDAATASFLRGSTQTGRPLASDTFLSRLETLVGRRLRPLPVGRPRRPRAETPG